MIIYINNRMPKKLKDQKKKILARKSVEYNEWINRINNINTNFSKNKKVNVNNVLSKPYIRETPKYDSLETIGGVATKPVIGDVYTGNKMKGIGTLHKSNAVPIFTDEEARDQANMRR
jgi:hypothetical protein